MASSDAVTRAVEGGRSALRAGRGMLLSIAGAEPVLHHGGSA